MKFMEKFRIGIEVYLNDKNSNIFKKTAPGKKSVIILKTIELSSKRKKR